MDLCYVIHAKSMKRSILKPAMMVTAWCLLIACNSSDNLKTKKQNTMFTLEQIKEAHNKVKSGADFPAYIRDLKKLGVSHYETIVSDGHSNYYGADNFKTTSPAKYETLTIAERCNKEQFETDLKEHQNGKTDYQTFIRT